MCLSHSKTTKLIRQLGDSHDSAVLEWKTKVETRQPSIINSPGSQESQRSHESLESQQSQESQTSHTSGTTESSEYSNTSSTSESKHTLALLQNNIVYMHSFLIAGDNTQTQQRHNHMFLHI